MARLDLRTEIVDIEGPLARVLADVLLGHLDLGPEANREESQQVRLTREIVFEFRGREGVGRERFIHGGGVGLEVVLRIAGQQHAAAVGADARVMADIHFMLDEFAVDEAVGGDFAHGGGEVRWDAIFEGREADALVDFAVCDDLVAGGDGDAVDDDSPEGGGGQGRNGGQSEKVVRVFNDLAGFVW